MRQDNNLKNIDIVKINILPPKPKRAKKTDGSKQIIEKKVKTGAPAIAICNYLKKHHGYTGSYAIIKDFIRKFNTEKQKQSNKMM